MPSTRLAPALFALALAVGLPAAAPKLARAATRAERAADPLAALGYDHVTQRLEARGARKDFVRLLGARADRRVRDKVIRTNVLGFRLKPDYSGHIDAVAIAKCRVFLHAHMAAFEAAERAHGVPKEVIASLLWVETRHGKTLGKFPLASVFMNLAMADHPAMIEQTLEALRKDVPETDPEWPALVEKVRARSAAKAEWALGELLALGEMRQRGLANPFRIKGSYAGAFGMPQFIPSSYLKWAEGGSPRAANLFAPRDAIRSVGNYLSQHGWGAENGLQRQALHAYNHSEAYVNTILSLAERLKPMPGREIARE